MKVLLAGVGNELRQDDAFGLLAIRAIQKMNDLPTYITIQEFGIGGIHLVQELHNLYDILVIFDAVTWGGKPGDLFWRAVDTADINSLSKSDKRNFLADMHYTNPVRALMLAKAVHVLPKEVYILGCEADSTAEFEMGVSKVVEDAIPKAVENIKRWVHSLQIVTN